METTKRALGLVAAVGLAAGALGALTVGQLARPVVGQAPTVESSEGAVSQDRVFQDTFFQDTVAGPLAQPGTPKPAISRPATSLAQPRREKNIATQQPSRVTVAPHGERGAAPAAPAEPTTFAQQPEAQDVSTHQPERAAVAPIEPAVPPAPEPRFEDLSLAAGSVIGIQIERAVTSETARVEDEVVARVTRDVRVGDRVAIPAGSRVAGVVTLVERGGRLRERARLGLRFTSVSVADGARVPIETEVVVREGDSPRNESAAKIGGGAIGGAILGGILGGAKGAAIGGSIGAGAGSAAVLTGGRNAASLPAGSPVTVRLEREATITVER